MLHLIGNLTLNLRDLGPTPSAGEGNSVMYISQQPGGHRRRGGPRYPPAKSTPLEIASLDCSRSREGKAEACPSATAICSVCCRWTDPGRDPVDPSLGTATTPSLSLASRHLGPRSESKALFGWAYPKFWIKESYHL